MINIIATTVWILILTAVGGYNSTSPAITTVTLTNRADCERIGRAWVAQHSHYRTFLCAEAQR